MKTVQLKPIRTNSGLRLGNTQYRLTAGQTSIELPDDDAYELEARYPHLIAESAPAPKTKKKAADVVDAAPISETSL